jgi:hypothetical protein
VAGGFLAMATSFMGELSGKAIPRREG